MKIRQAESFST